MAKMTTGEKLVIFGLTAGFARFGLRLLASLAPIIRWSNGDIASREDLTIPPGTTKH